MAPRRVIADSDDEDEGDIPLIPSRDYTVDSPPRPELLSPYHRPPSPRMPGRTQVSDTTDGSFFASVYDEQQTRAREQSQLVEHIVRQSQKASANSDEVSSPARGRDKTKTDVSSGTSVTSPRVLSRPGNHQSLLSDDATNITSPRKTLPGEWDVPSSPEIPRDDNKRSHSNRRGNQPKGMVSTTITEAPLLEDFGHTETPRREAFHDEIPERENVESFPLPATKRRRVSLHGSMASGSAAGLYVAQSNLTTMQKLEYQKIHVPQSGYSSLTDSLSHQKSSGVTTIAYPTPSRYAPSSGPPLPWEKANAADTQPRSSHAIDANFVFPRCDFIWPRLRKGSQNYGATSRKGRKRPKSIQDEDELVHDESRNSETANHHHKDNENPQLQRGKPNSPNPDERSRPAEPVHVPSPRGASPRADPQEERDESNAEIPATEPPAPVDEPEIAIQPPPQPKKRGRKKKSELAAEHHPAEPAPAPAPAPEARSEEPEKPPKRKRGRPRKADRAAKPEPEAAVTPVAEPAVAAGGPEDDGDGDGDGAPAPPGQVDGAEVADTDEEGEGEEEAAGGQKPRKRAGAGARGRGRGAASPLRETSRNSKGSPPAEPTTTTTTTTTLTTTTDRAPKEEAGEGAKAEEEEEEKGDKQKAKAKAKAKQTPVPRTPSYRVGLSRRTQITSLLKSIKR
ncbi:hypothetical protein GGS23DRAFT_610595 [Durotheca rogersii]|uniref:uncharacterized protein n=1 Tax=Durotheca rogersii TaxID=419775 RepID=UPI00221EB9E3|nr:uncharacterized protein GGS23DRAFT_610595 [Durotheca rogersii]KAI5862409.1 hypothetical protein GGS23DRAFT_610595 [Durotheca rogersii]